eukprot:SAG31_NODE_2987_length_4816_cov_4.118084_1_plen_479_part_00
MRELAQAAARAAAQEQELYEKAQAKSKAAARRHTNRKAQSVSASTAAVQDRASRQASIRSQIAVRRHVDEKRTKRRTPANPSDQLEHPPRVSKQSSDTRSQRSAHLDPTAKAAAARRQNVARKTFLERQQAAAAARDARARGRNYHEFVREATSNGKKTERKGLAEFLARVDADLAQRENRRQAATAKFGCISKTPRTGAARRDEYAKPWSRNDSARADFVAPQNTKQSPFGVYQVVGQSERESSLSIADGYEGPPIPEMLRPELADLVVRTAAFVANATEAAESEVIARGAANPASLGFVVPGTDSVAAKFYRAQLEWLRRASHQQARLRRNTMGLGNGEEKVKRSTETTFYANAGVRITDQWKAKEQSGRMSSPRQLGPRQALGEPDPVAEHDFLSHVEIVLYTKRGSKQSEAAVKVLSSAALSFQEVNVHEGEQCPGCPVDAPLPQVLLRAVGSTNKSTYLGGYSDLLKYLMNSG